MAEELFTVQADTARPFTRDELRQAMLLYAVTDRAWCANGTADELTAQVEAALQGGATCVQLREKQLDDADFLEEAFRIRDLCRAHHVPFFVNDNVGVALAVGADGVHVGQEDMPLAEVRRLVGPDMLIGVSVQTVAQAIAAEEGGADCLGVGAMVATSTKTDAQVVTGETLHDICAAVEIPVVAIGGINEHTMGMLAGTGVDGAACVSAIFAAPDITAACRDLKALAADAVAARPLRFTAAIFDFDGTLFDSMPLWYTCGDQFLLGVGRTPEPNLWDTFRTMSLEQAAAWVKADYGLDLTEQQIIDGINATVEHGYFHEVLPKPGVVDFVRDLRKRGVSCGIATATDAYLVEAALARCGMGDLFEVIFTCGGLHTTKHEPLIFEKAAKALGADADTAVVFEDAIHAIRTAKGAGFTVVGIANDFQDDPEEIRGTVDVFLDTFECPESFWDFAEAR